MFSLFFSSFYDFIKEALSERDKKISRNGTHVQGYKPRRDVMCS